MNFRWDKQNKKSLLNEEDEIVYRRNYLHSMREFRIKNTNIYYLDEAWFHLGYIVGKVWQDKNITSSRQSSLDGFSTEIKAPSGKEKRLITTNIGGVHGFVKGGLLAFQSKRTCDYHEDMNADVFKQMIDLIPPNSVKVMDNASYNSRQCEKIPNTAWKIPRIIQWLLETQILFQEKMVKKELLSIVQHYSLYRRYRLQVSARKRKKQSTSVLVRS